MAAAQASLADSAVVVDLPPKPESQLAKEVTLTEEDKALLELLFDEYEDALGQKLKPLRKLKADWESELSSDIEELEEDGETFEAEPLLCRLAYYQLQMRGPDHPTTIQTVFRLTQNINQQGGNDIDYLTWLLPRFTALHGLNHPDTRKLVEQAALHLCQTEDDREHPEFSKIVTELVGQLPGGLGWGNTMSTPITDEAAFNRHVVMEQRAAKAFVDGHYKLSQDMYQRCVASFSTLGAHWLGTPRRLRCLHGIAMATIALEGGAAAQQKAQDVKSMCQRELGPRHEVTLELALQSITHLLPTDRAEQALSVLQKTLRIRKETLGPHHAKVIECQATLGGVLCTMGQHKEAEAALKDALEWSLKVVASDSKTVVQCVATYHILLMKMGRKREAKALKQRAANSGCDVYFCSPKEVVQKHMPLFKGMMYGRYKSMQKRV